LVINGIGLMIGLLGKIKRFFNLKQIIKIFELNNNNLNYYFLKNTNKPTLLGTDFPYFFQ
jgi:hypothetical protein